MKGLGISAINGYGILPALKAALADKADKSDVTRVLNALDAIRGVVEDAETERTAHAAQLTRHEEAIVDIDERVTALQRRAA